MRPITLFSKLLNRVSSILRTQAAREVAILGPHARLTLRGSVDNIYGQKDAVVIGERTIIAGQLLTFGHSGKIQIGDWAYVGEGSRIWSAAEVIIGNRALISHNVSIIDTNSHPLDAEVRFEHTKALFTSGHPRSDPGIVSTPIRIGDDAWISYGASILRGVTIGEGAIVGASAVVTRDVEPWAVVAGNPAMVITRLEPSTPSK